MCVHKGQVLVACRSGRLAAYTLATGQELWRGQAGGPIVGSPLWIGNRVLIPVKSELAVFQVAP